MSLVKANTYQDASGGSNAVFSGVSSPPNSMGFRNRIINGDMRIDQRNAGASVNPGTGAYSLDRWFGGGVHDGVLAFQQVSDGPTGFTNSLRVTVSTADSSLGATQYARVGQIIEGFNVSDFAAGTASAISVTFSFWVKSSLTGTFGGYLANGDETRIYIFQYTINAASTWEQKTVTVPLLTSGTWATNNTAGMRAFFSLGAGSSYVNTANTWLTSYAQQASGNINVLNTASATWQITGVQLEAGTNASAFERIDYGRQLIQCQRYFSIGLPSGTDINWPVVRDATTSFQFVVTVPVVMRATPTLGVPSGYGRLVTYDTSFSLSVASMSAMSLTWFVAGTQANIYCTNSSVSGSYVFAGYDTAGTTTNLTFSAEL